MFGLAALQLLKGTSWCPSVTDLCSAALIPPFSPIKPTLSHLPTFYHPFYSLYPLALIPPLSLSLSKIFQTADAAGNMMVTIADTLYDIISLQLENTVWDTENQNLDHKHINIKTIRSSQYPHLSQDVACPILPTHLDDISIIHNVLKPLLIYTALKSHCHIVIIT